MTQSARFDFKKRNKKASDLHQALCKRTLNIVEKISEKHAERMRFYLSKADEAGHESDRQRVMMQIVQVFFAKSHRNLCNFVMANILFTGVVQEAWSEQNWV